MKDRERASPREVLVNVLTWGACLTVGLACAAGLGVLVDGALQGMAR